MNLKVMSTREDVTEVLKDISRKLESIPENDELFDEYFIFFKKEEKKYNQILKQLEE